MAILPRTCPAWLSSNALAARASGNTSATGTVSLPGVGEVGERGQVVGVGPHPQAEAAGLGDRRRRRWTVAATLRENGLRHVEHAAHEVGHDVDAVGRERTHPLGQPVAIRHGLGTQPAQELVVALRGGADHAGAEGPGDLDGEEADAAGGGVDEDGLAVLEPRAGRAAGMP